MYRYSSEITYNNYIYGEMTGRYDTSNMPNDIYLRFH